MKEVWLKVNRSMIWRWSLNNQTECGQTQKVNILCVFCSYLISKADSLEGDFVHFSVRIVAFCMFLFNEVEQKTQLIISLEMQWMSDKLSLPIQSWVKCCTKVFGLFLELYTLLIALLKQWKQRMLRWAFIIYVLLNLFRPNRGE